MPNPIKISVVSYSSIAAFQAFLNPMSRLFWLTLQSKKMFSAGTALCLSTHHHHQLHSACCSIRIPLSEPPAKGQRLGLMPRRTGRGLGEFAWSVSLAFASGLLSATSVHVLPSALFVDHYRVLAAASRRAPYRLPIVITLHHASARKPFFAAAIRVNLGVWLEPAVHWSKAAIINPCCSRLMRCRKNM